MNRGAVIEVDFWENQRYNPITGWSVGRAPPYSDITCKIPFNHDKVKTGTVYQPEGWEWCSADWAVDMSTLHGEVDEQGWSYAGSFEALMEQSRLKSLRNERSNMNVVRRRRWVRTRRCSDPAERLKHAAKIAWIEFVRRKTEDVHAKHKNNYDKLVCHHERQDHAAREIVTVGDNVLRESAKALHSLRGQLVAMKAFLADRGAVEASYAKKLVAVAKKWGDLPTISGKYFSTPRPLKSSNGRIESKQSPSAKQRGNSSAAESVKSTNEGTTSGYMSALTSTMKSTVRTIPHRSRSFFSSTPFAPAKSSVEGSGHGSSGGSDCGSAHSIDIIDFSDADDFDAELPEEEAEICNAGSNGEQDIRPTGGIALSNPSSPERSNGRFSPQRSPARSGSSKHTATFFTAVSEANRSVAQRLTDFSNLLALSLPLDIDELIRDIDDSLDDCKVEGNKMRSEINAHVKSARRSLDAYCKCYESSQIDIAQQGNFLCDKTYRASAALEDSNKIDGFFTSGYAAAASAAFSSASATFGSYVSTAKGPEMKDQSLQLGGNQRDSNDTLIMRNLSRSDSFNAFIGVENVDVWLAMQFYCCDVTSIGGVLMMYDAFSRMQIKKLQTLSNTVLSLLKSTMKMFVDEQFRVWQDASSILDGAGVSNDSNVIRRSSSAHNAVESSVEKTSLGTEQRQESEQSGRIQQQDALKLGPNSSPALRLFNSLPVEALSSLGSDAATDGGDSSSSISAGAGGSETSAPHSPQMEYVTNVFQTFHREFRDDFPHEAYIAYHGPLAYCTVSVDHVGGTASSGQSATTSSSSAAAISNEMNFAAHNPISQGKATNSAAATASGTKKIAREELTEHSIWDDAYVLVTFDRVIHILKPPQAQEDSLRFSKDRLLISINARGAEVNPVFIPKEGYRDAFEVVPSEDRRKGKAIPSLDNIMINAASTVVGTSSLVESSLNRAVKDVGSIVFIADNPLMVRNWMRVIANPFTDPNMDPPYSESFVDASEAVVNDSTNGAKPMNDRLAGNANGKTQASIFGSGNNTIGSGKVDDEMVVEGANPQRVALLRNKSRSLSVKQLAQDDLVVAGENPLR